MSLTRGIVLSLALCGCVPQSAPVEPKGPVAKRDTVWSALADRIESGKVETTSEGLLILRELVRSGDLSRDEAAKVDQLGWEKDRKLTSDDQSRLRGL